MNKVLSLLSIALLLSGAAVSVASAKTIDIGADADIEIGVGAGSAAAGARADADAKQKSQEDASIDDADESAEEAADVEVRGNATSAAMQERNKEREDVEAEVETHGEITSAEHRSTVAAFVRTLLGVADREQGGIGEQVRVVAKNQEESADATAEAMAEVESRSALKTFFFGSDYKNLGVIRSGIASTSAHLDQLARMRDKAATETDKAELTAQINVLAQAQADLDAYVEAHESAFSVFGWFVRLFEN